MPSSPAETEEIRSVLGDLHTWAVVGCSPDPRRASNGVARFLQERGKRVIPIYPGEDEILGEAAFPDLASVPDDAGVEVVDIFRRSDQAGVHVDEAIAAGAKAVWLQLGVIDDAAARRARDAGLLVVMDRCPKIEWPRVLR